MDGNDKRTTKYTYKWKLWVEILVTSVTIAVVWGLLSLPSVFYFLPQSSGSRVSQQVQQTSCTNYTKTTCHQVLTQSKSCFGIIQSSSNIMIAANVDQEANENTVQLIISGLPFLGATEMCTSSFIPFMCLYLFPLCDGNGTAHQPSRDQCIEISTVVCKDEWQKAALIPGVVEKLPDCESLSKTITNEDFLCLERIVPLDALNKSTTPANSTQIQCEEQFFLSNGICLPQCGEWKQYDNTVSVVTDTAIIISAVVGLGCGIFMLIFSCWKKKIFTFPAVIIIYMTITMLPITFFILITFMDRTTLFCSSKNVIEVLKVSTPFCSVIGAMYYYTLLQLPIWWLCHVIIMFWNLRFPFHAKVFVRIKAIHVTMVLLALLLPTIPVIASFSTGGFVIVSNPPNLCVSRRSDAAYYTLALPISVIMATGISLLVMVFIIVIKHSNAAKNQTTTAKIHFGTPERKLLLVLCYYVIFGSETLVTFAVSTTNIGAYIAAVSNYFACEANGNSTSGRCDAERKGFESLNHFELTVLAYILLGLLPAVNLVFVMNCKKIKECICVKK